MAHRSKLLFKKGIDAQKAINLKNNLKNEMNPEHSSQNAYMSIRDFELNVSNRQ